MTREDIIQMAQKAGFVWLGEYHSNLEDFAKLVAQRTWVGLDEEDYIKAYELCDFDKVAAFDFFESKLKEKNT